ncbi:(2Fe-2S)-binding protein [Paracoccus cavernae]|uniref:(2Fe-2S)-binding protein n=1 Tax=Paracoccus cavernae TaxID=1571207 RepID=A0ABT8D6L1_9RHOB|nr:(2Fe-2S)-binding protein [Paracoccus cavernae]
MASFTVNGRDYNLDIDPDTPLLWVLRDELRLTGTKFGCGVSQCGACTVMLDGMPRRACVTPVSMVEGSDITTIEGVESREAKAVQAAWTALDVPQCGWCQSGQILSAAALLQDNPKPTDEDIDHAMAGNLCRCATYVRIRKAIHEAAKTLEG